MTNLGGIDAGGPRREYMSNLAVEIMEKLKIFVKTPNAVHNVGEEREKWVPNPKANSRTDLENFYKVGFVIAFVLKTRECLEVSITSLFWKYLISRLILI